MHRSRNTIPQRDRNGLVLGVLKGPGRHFGVASWILRLIVIGLAVTTSFWIVLVVYLVLAILMPPRPDTFSTIF